MSKKEKVITSVDVISKISEQLNKNVKISIDKNPEVFSRIMQYIDILNYYRIILQDVDQSIILDEINYDLLCSINNAANGMYRVANMCTRSAIELGIGFLYFVDNNFKYLLWKQNKYDIKWSALLDEENGVITKNYLGLFCESETLTTFITEVRNAYRESSEYVHGKYNYMHSVEGTTVIFCEDQLIKWSETFKNIAEILCVLLTIRFSANLDDIQNDKIEQCLELIKKRNIKGVLDEY
jgi:hypothetical protein